MSHRPPIDPSTVTVEEACATALERGRVKYRSRPGDPFVGDPVHHLFEELIDAANYAREAKLDGFGEFTGRIAAGTRCVEDEANRHAGVLG